MEADDSRGRPEEAPDGGCAVDNTDGERRGDGASNGEVLSDKLNSSVSCNDSIEKDPKQLLAVDIKKDDSRQVLIVPPTNEEMGSDNDINILSEKSAGVCNSFCEDILDPTDINGKKRRHRRRNKGGKHHRKWKPYDKLTWDERKTQEERETRRACQKRESRFASGQAMAPYNTTQFLMEQHEPEESELHLDEANRRMRERVVSIRGQDPDGGGAGVSGSGSGDGSSDEYCESNEEEIFLEKDFTEAYEQYQAERLQSMTKEELVREHIALESEVEDLKRQLKNMENLNRRNSGGASNNMDSADSVDAVKVGSLPQSMELEIQVENLREENKRLSSENGQLKLHEGRKCIVASNAIVREVVT